MTKAHTLNIAEHIEVGIGVPSLGGWTTNFGRSLIDLFQHTTSWRPKEGSPIKSFRIRLYTQETSMLVKSRHNLVVAALKDNCTHLLFLDSDMTFPKDTLVRLLERNKPVIAVNATTRAYPVKHIAHGLDGKLLDSRNKVGVQKVQHVGAAVMLINLEVVKNMLPPLFMMEWIPEMKDYCGEDVYFSMKVQQEGYDTWVDHDLSQEVGHEGRQIFGPGMIDLGKPQTFLEKK